MHTTNYFDTFIQVAYDCPTSVGEVPLAKGDKQTVANQQFDIIRGVLKAHFRSEKNTKW
jgi:hypothetical protein